MYKVLLVEDEVSARRWLTKMIDWTALGFELVEVAHHGLAAWELLQEHPDIDLIITDIRMPEMDGIELVKRIRSLYGTRSDIIIVSGYGEFKYAQEALRYQVNDYILKPISKEQFTDLLSKIVTRIEARTRLSNNLLYANQQRKENEEKEKQAFFERWLIGREAEASSQREWITYRLPDEESRMLLYVAELDSYDRLVTQLPEVDMNLCRFMIRNIVDDVSSKIGRSQCVFLTPNHFIVMINAKDPLNDNTIKLIGQNFQETLKRYARIFDIELSLGCVRVTGSWNALPAFYDQACTALAYRFFTGKQSIHLYAPAMVRATDIPYPTQMEKDILNAFKQQQFKQGKQMVSLLLSDLYHRGSIPSIRFIASEMLIQLLKELRDVKSLPVMREVMEAHCQEIRNADTFEDLSMKLLESIDFILNTIQLESKEMSVVAKGMEHMKLKLNRDISLLEVAEYVGVSPSYYSTLFKQETGCRFVDYLTRLRMERGIELLETTEKTVAMIGDEIGYSHYRYFIKVFKDYYGMTPSQYRRKIKDPSAHIS